MSSTLLLLVAIVLPTADAADSTQTPRRHHFINNDLRAAIHAEATAKTDAQRADGIHQMVAVYEELRSDPRMATSPTLRQYKARLWARLIKVKKDLLREISYEQKNLRRDGQATEPPMNERARRATQEDSEVFAAQMALVSYSLGGPAQFLAQSEGALGGGMRDDSRALIELIERTISPEFWDVNGGPGTIVYYAPLHALVVRATAEVHGHIGGAVGALRKAGP